MSRYANLLLHLFRSRASLLQTSALTSAYCPANLQHGPRHLVFMCFEPSRPGRACAWSPRTCWCSSSPPPPTVSRSLTFPPWWKKTVKRARWKWSEILCIRSIYSVFVKSKSCSSVLIYMYVPVHYRTVLYLYFTFQENAHCYDLFVYILTWSFTRI